MTGTCAIVLVPLLKKKFYATETMMLVASLVSMSLSIILYGVSVKTWMLFLGESLGGVIACAPGGVVGCISA